LIGDETTIKGLEGDEGISSGIDLSNDSGAGGLTGVSTGLEVKNFDSRTSSEGDEGISIERCCIGECSLLNAAEVEGQTSKGQKLGADPISAASELSKSLKGISLNG
jgi:hypothetical protein